MKSRAPLTTIWAILFPLLLLAGRAAGELRLWDGSSNNNWRHFRNWSDQIVPSPGDDALFSFDAIRNVVDLSSSDSAGSAVDRRVNVLALTTDGTNPTSEPGPTVDWYLKWGRIQANEIHWGNLGSNFVLRLHANLLVSGVMKFTGRSGIHHLHFHGDSAVTVGDGATLQCQDATVLGNLAGSGTLDVDADIEVGGATFVFATFNGTLNGTGAITFTGGNRHLNGSAGNFSGQVITTGGALNPAASRLGNSLVTINADESLDLKVDTTLGGLAGTGDLTLDFPLSFGGENADSIFSGDLSGSRALTKTGTGKWTFDGTNNSGGLTTIADGWLKGDGSFAGDLTVASGAGNRIAPGSSVGTIAVGGDLTLSATYECEIDGADSDRLEVAGLLDLGAAAGLDISQIGAGATQEVYIIANYGSLSGTFSSPMGIPAFYFIDYAYDDGIASNNIALVKDVVAPNASAITLATPRTPDTPSAVFEVTFDESVVNFDDEDDLDITSTGLLLWGTPVIVSTGPTTYPVTFSPLAGTGTVQFAVATDSDVHDLVGNALASSATGAAEPVDTDPPVVDSITAPGGTIGADTVDFTVVFNEPVTGFDAVGDLDVAKDADLGYGGVSFLPPVGGTHTVRFTGLSGEGDLTVGIAFLSDVKDLAGNSLMASTRNATAAIDRVGPSATLGAVTASPTETDTVEFTIDFDQAVMGLTFADLDVGFTGGTFGTPLIGGDGRNWTVIVPEVEGYGNLSLDIATGNTIEDAVGNGLENDPAPASVDVVQTPIHYVSPSGGNTAPYQDWASAAASLQDALAVAPPGEEIWVAAGTYRPDEGAAQTPGDRTSTFRQGRPWSMPAQQRFCPIPGTWRAGRAS